MELGSRGFYTVCTYRCENLNHTAKLLYIQWHWFRIPALQQNVENVETTPKVLPLPLTLLWIKLHSPISTKRPSPPPKGSGQFRSLQCQICHCSKSSCFMEPSSCQYDFLRTYRDQKPQSAVVIL